MKILVCISHVPDTTSKISFKNDNTALEDNGLTFVINPYDEFCLTRALMIKEQQGGQVTVLHVGNASTEPTLRKALAIGADNAVRLNHDAGDAQSVAKAITSYLESNAYDLVLMGKESIDYNGGLVPGLVAAHLDYPFVNACIGLDVDGTNLTLTREIDGGKEQLSAVAPVVLAGQKGLVEEKDLRIPSMRGIMMARKKQLEVVDAQGEPSVSVEQFESPSAKAACKLFDVNQIDDLVKSLHEEAKVI
ncbi:MAG: electron transfer flavoprotein subunit beta/FixA family protein [Flavobacteriales bacterium]